MYQNYYFNYIIYTYEGEWLQLRKISEMLLLFIMSGNEKLLFAFVAFVNACPFDLSAFGRFYLI